MSIKKLFESSNKVQEFVSKTSTKDLFTGDAESLENVIQKKVDAERYTPQLDYSQPENFAKYGSARLYYKSALSRITDFYPYDGSEAEINKFLNGCLDVERYVLENQYPRSTGYISLNSAGHNIIKVEDGFAKPVTSEYIDLFGGPGTGSAATSNLKDLMPNAKDNKYNYSNIYDESIYTTANLPSDYGSGTRTSNLRADFNEGVTVEFWLKTGSADYAGVDTAGRYASTQRQVIFDLWNNELSSSAQYGRMMIEVTGEEQLEQSPLESALLRDLQPCTLCILVVLAQANSQAGTTMQLYSRRPRPHFMSTVTETQLPTMAEPLDLFTKKILLEESAPLSQHQCQTPAPLPRAAWAAADYLAPWTNSGFGRVPEPLNKLETIGLIKYAEAPTVIFRTQLSAYTTNSTKGLRQTQRQIVLY